MNTHMGGPKEISINCRLMDVEDKLPTTPLSGELVGLAVILPTTCSGSKEKKAIIIQRIYVPDDGIIIRLPGEETIETIFFNSREARQISSFYLADKETRFGEWFQETAERWPEILERYSEDE